MRLKIECTIVYNWKQPAPAPPSGAYIYQSKITHTHIHAQTHTHTHTLQRKVYRDGACAPEMKVLHLCYRALQCALRADTDETSTQKEARTGRHVAGSRQTREMQVSRSYSMCLCGSVDLLLLLLSLPLVSRSSCLSVSCLSQQPD